MENRVFKKLKSKILPYLLVIILVGGGFLIWFYFKPSNQTPPAQSQTETPVENTQFELKIDKIGVISPVIENVDGTKKSVYNEALKGGVAHYLGTSLPGQGSNIFIFGHSSTILGRGSYAKIFAHLNDLKNGDLIVINYHGKEFKYAVFEKKIVSKDDVSVLRPTQSEQLTLMTCWPIGSDAKRLIIKANPY